MTSDGELPARTVRPGARIGVDVGNARVGNFGLVCATYKRSYDPSLRTSTRPPSPRAPT